MSIRDSPGAVAVRNAAPLDLDKVFCCRISNGLRRRVQAPALRGQRERRARPHFRVVEVGHPLAHVGRLRAAEHDVDDVVAGVVPRVREHARRPVRGQVRPGGLEHLRLVPGGRRVRLRAVRARPVLDLLRVAVRELSWESRQSNARE